MAQNTVTIAKITGPRLVKGVISRNWLFKRIDQSRRAQAVWVAGPGGSGKTTLMSSYLEERSIPALWYHLDEGDSDTATFFHYMGLAVKGAIPDARPLPLLTPEYADSLSTFTKRYFEDLFDRVKKPSVLVLDNYQEVPGDSKFHNVIRDCLPIVPDKVTVFILSRTQPPPEMARAVARRFMAVIGWKELRFTLDETHALVRLIEPKKYTAAAVHHLHRKTDGWVAGLLLLLRQASLEEIDPAFLSSHTPEEVFQYFATEIFDATSPELQEFLLATAIFPHMTSKMAKALTGVARADRILADMRTNHLFTSRRMGKEPVYEYHPLFREFLLARGRSRYTVHQLSDINSKAAGLLEMDGQIETAMSLYHSSGDSGNMARLILNQAQTLIFQGRHLTLNQWLERLPDELVDQDPWLLYWLAACREPVDPAEGRKMFNKALSASLAQDNTNGILNALCSLIESVTHEFDSFAAIDQWVPKLQAIYREMGSCPSADTEARVISSFLYALTFRQPGSAEYAIWQQRAIDMLERGEIVNMNAVLQLILPITLHSIFSGELADAEHTLEKYRSLLELEGAGPLAVTGLRNLEGFCYWLQGKTDESLKAADEGLETATATGVHVFSTYLAGHGAAAALSAMNLGLAEEYLVKMKAHLGHARAWGLGAFHTMSNWLALIRQDCGKAALHSRQAVEFQEKTGSPQGLAITQLGRALALFLMGEKTTARTYLEMAIDNCRRVKTSLVEFGCYLVQSEFALDAGDDAGALAALRKAMVLGRKNGYVNTYFWRPQVMTRLCEKALTGGIEVDYVQGLVRTRDLVPDEPPWETENWPWPVRIFTMGRFALEVNGAFLSFSGKAPRAPLSVLKALIAFGAEDVAECSLQDALWPEADGDAASNAFSTNLHRLRKMLGNDKAIRVFDGRISFDNRLCWVDAQLLKKWLKKAENIWLRNRKGDRSAHPDNLMEKIMTLAPGIFLPDETYPWAIPLREELKSRLLQCIQSFVRHLVEAENIEAAVYWCNRTLTIDSCNEHFYQQLMRLYKKQGMRSQVLATYQRCCDNLAALYGDEPSDETKAVFRISK